MKGIIVFGGSGFVGMHLSFMLHNDYDKIFIADIRPPHWHCKDFSENERSVYVNCDVRKPIDPSLFANCDISCIVNLAAVHTSPGHEPHEYFETNILGARNVCALAEKLEVKRIIFTSSISVYGPGEDEKTENSVPMPAIPYGSSKAIAEHIHKEWKCRSENRYLLILRPGVIFGKGEGGNFTRIANALERGFFPYPGRKNTVKACLYVKDICRFIIGRMTKGEGFELYNFCYDKKYTTEEIVTAFKKVLGYKAFCPVIPYWLVVFGASLLRLIKIPAIQKMGLVPDRILKLIRSTNISSKHLIKNAPYLFPTDLEIALEDWKIDCKGKHLY